MFLQNAMQLAATVADTAAEDFFNFQFTPESLKETLPLLGIGMGGIFIALLVIYLFSLLLQKALPEKKKEKKS